MVKTKNSTSWEDEYLITNDQGTMVPSGNLLLKVIIRESHLDTNATTQSIRMKMSNLDKYMSKINSDITKFNGYVKLLEGSLAARGQKSEALLTHLFKGYLAASDKVFVKYITEKMDRYEEGEEMSPDRLTQLADNKYRLLRERDEWDAPSAEEEKLLALQAEVEKLKRVKKRKAEDKGGNNLKPSKRRPKGKEKSQDKPAWMFKRPSDDDLHKPKKWNGKDWWYCGTETGGKCDGEYRRHKPSECKGRTFKRDGGSTGKHPQSNQKKGEEERSLKVSEALSTIIQEDGNATESDDSEGYES